MPNAAAFGYFDTTWRAWPASPPPLDRTNPRELGFEVLPTPQGEPQPELEKVPVPKQTLPIEEPYPGGFLPPGGSGGGILPPEGGFQIEGMPRGSGRPSDSPPAILPPDVEEPAEPGIGGIPPGTPPLDTPPLDTPPSGVIEEPSLTTPKEPTISTPSTDAGASIQQPEQPANAPTTEIKANWTSALEPSDSIGRQRPALLSPSVGEDSRPIKPASASEEMEAPLLQPANEQAAVVKPAPIQLDGFCPVTLIEGEKWIPGESRIKSVYKGRTYLFSSEAHKKAFLENPSRYAPAFDGNDPVLAVEKDTRTPGKTDYCVTYAGKLYMFTGAITLTRFQNNPQRYIQAAGK